MRSLFKTNPLTKWSGVLIFAIICITVFEKEQWKKPNGVIASDVKGYYGYLPALFIHDDLQLKNVEPYIIDGDLKLWFSTSEDGQRFIKFPAGMAIMYSPFFAVAHLTAEAYGQPANGYSEIYRKALTYGSLLYFVLGLIFFSKLLLRHFDDRTTATTLLVIYLATNLYYYTALDGFLTHGYTFFLFSAFMYGCVRWLDTQRWSYVFLLGITGGLMIAVRHIDVWFLLFVVLYGIRSIKDLKKRFQLFWKFRWKTLVGGGLIILMMTPQFLYHYSLFGTIFHYAYSDERFFFGDPHLIDALFSYRNGWLLYTPIMIFAVIGILLLRKRVPEMFTISIIGLPVYYYVLASWWCWWFVGFGNRAYINMYPLLAFSLAALVAYLYEKQRKLWVAFNFIVLGAIVLNTFQSEQFRLGILHWDSETKAHYWHVFGKSQRTQTQDFFLETPDNPAAKRNHDSVYVQRFATLSKQVIDFETDPEKQKDFKGSISKRFVFKGQQGIFVPVNNEFSVQLPFNAPPETTHIYITAWAKGSDEYRLVIDAKNEVSPFVHLSSEVVSTQGAWKKLHLMAVLPKNYKNTDYLFYIWNQNKAPFGLDEITISCLKGSQELKAL